VDLATPPVKHSRYAARKKKKKKEKNQYCRMPVHLTGETAKKDRRVAVVRAGGGGKLDRLYRWSWLRKRISKFLKSEKGAERNKEGAKRRAVYIKALSAKRWTPADINWCRIIRAILNSQGISEAQREGKKTLKLLLNAHEDAGKQEV